MATAAPSDATFELLYNGLDFLVSAVDYLRGRPTACDMKYGVLHISAGVALILKERLRREDPRLLFADEAKFSAAAYEAGTFRSIGIEDAIKKLKALGVHVPRSVTAALSALGDERNRLEHFGAAISIEELSAVTASALSFVIDFVREHLGKLDSRQAGLLHDLQDGLPEFSAFVDQRMVDIAPRLGAATATRVCPSCSAEALMLGDEYAECAFCTRKHDPSDAADEYISSVLGVSQRDVIRGADWPRHQCPECEADALVREGDGDVCFHCGTEFALGSLQQCSSCTNLYPSDLETAVCDDCFRASIHDD